MFALLRINLGTGIYPLTPPHQRSLPWSAPAQDPLVARGVCARSSVGHRRLRGQRPLCFPLLLNLLWRGLLTPPPT